MAYTPGFINDIFISYAHVDNQPIQDKTKGWVIAFIDQLKIYLDGMLGRKDSVEIWYDKRKIDGSQFFDKTIEDNVLNSALFISILSNGYLQSDYCLKELCCFNQKIVNDSIGIETGDRSRIFSALITNIDYNLFPDGIKGTTGFVFHENNSNEDYCFPVDPSGNEFIMQIRSFVNALFKSLKSIKCKLSEKSSIKQEKIVQIQLKDKISQLNTNPEPDKSFPVFFSEVSDSLRHNKKRIITDLQKKGIYVLKNIPPPFDINNHDNEISNILENAKLTVHMFDEFAGKEIDEIPDETYPIRQFKLCSEKSQSKLIWTPKTININEIEDESYKKFFNNLENFSGQNTDFIDGNKSEFLNTLLDTIDYLKQKQSRQNHSIGKKPSVLIDSHQKDNIYVVDLINYFSENNINFRLNLGEDSPREKMEIYNEHLMHINTLIIIYGVVTQKWLLSRFGILSKLIKKNNFEINKTIFLAPPNKEKEKQELEDMIYEDVKFIDNSSSNKLNKDVLTPLLQTIKCGGV